MKQGTKQSISKEMKAKQAQAQAMERMRQKANRAPAKLARTAANKKRRMAKDAALKAKRAYHAPPPVQAPQLGLGFFLQQREKAHEIKGAVHRIAEVKALKNLIAVMDKLATRARLVEKQSEAKRELEFAPRSAS